MLTVLLTIQILLAVAMVGIILFQRTDSDGLSGLGGGGSNHNVLSGRAAANILTRTTAILACLFMLNSLAMATITTRSVKEKKSLLETLETQEPLNSTSSPEAPASVPENEQPSVPIAE